MGSNKQAVTQKPSSISEPSKARQPPEIQLLYSAGSRLCISLREWVPYASVQHPSWSERHRSRGGPQGKMGSSSAGYEDPNQAD